MKIISDKEYNLLGGKIPLYCKYNGQNFYLFVEEISESYKVGYKMDDGCILATEFGETPFIAAIKLMYDMATRWKENLGISLSVKEDGEYVVD